MKPKTAIIISIILVIAFGLFAVYLFDISKYQKYINNSQIKPIQLNDGTQTSNKEIKEKLSPEELKQKMLDDLDKISDQEYKNKIMNLSESEKEELKQQMLDDLDKISE